MQTVKQEVVETILKLPETVDIDQIIEELEHFRQEKKATVQDETKPASCLDLMKDYIGCFEGPEDLSINKVYMERYGL